MDNRLYYGHTCFMQTPRNTTKNFGAVAASSTSQCSKPPLAVDFDGTLARSDSLIEAFLHALSCNPMQLPNVISCLKSGRLEFKKQLLSIEAYQPDTIPLDEDLVAFLRAEKSNGREIHLVTASPQQVADRVAERVRVFDSAIGSSGRINLKGERKAKYLLEHFPDGFAYAGNDQSDLPVWRHAKSAIVVGASKKVDQSLKKMDVDVEQRFERDTPSLKTWLRLVRIHHWTKNVLLFAPLMLSNQHTNTSAIVTIFIAFLCMGMVASATYIFNDLCDLEADRQHATKCFRPLASTDISIGSGSATAGTMGFIGIAGAVALDSKFALLLGLYILLTTAYSLVLKTIPILDVFVIGFLFTLRIIMGIALLHVPPSAWLIAFSFFLFLSLSIAKRHVEIVRAAQRTETENIKGRGYGSNDAPIILGLGLSSNAIAVTLLFLYVANDAYPEGMYHSPDWLWALSPLIFLWSSRIWLMSHRGLLDDDPIIFALKDAPSLGLGLCAIACFGLAAF